MLPRGGKRIYLCGYIQGWTNLGWRTHDRKATLTLERVLEDSIEISP